MSLPFFVQYFMVSDYFISSTCFRNSENTFWYFDKGIAQSDVTVGQSLIIWDKLMDVLAPKLLAAVDNLQFCFQHYHTFLDLEGDDCVLHDILFV